MPLSPGSQFGAYRIVRPLGRGGMASVHEAHEPGLDRRVALKVLPAEFLHDPDFADRFRHEAKLVAKLEHRHIVPIYAFGIDEGIPWMAMRLVTGGTVSALLKKGPLDRRRAVEILLESAEALDYAHRQGVLHRDVKPQNILLDEDGHVYLADFGVAKMLEGSPVLTKTGILQGTPQYMSPEQARAETVDRRTDVYALGVVAYEMFTGRLPFTADTPVAVLMKHVMDPIPLPAPQEVPEPLLRPLLRCLAKNREERWATAGAFASALHQGLGARAAPTTEQPPTVALSVAPTEPARAAVQLSAEPPGPAKPKARAPRRRLRRDPSSSWSVPLKARRFGSAWFVMPSIAAAAFVVAIIGNLTVYKGPAPSTPSPATGEIPPATVPLGVGTSAPPAASPPLPTPAPTNVPPVKLAARPWPDVLATAAPRRAPTAAPATPPPMTMPPRGPVVGVLVGNPADRSDATSKKTFEQGLGGAPTSGFLGTMDFEVSPPDIAVGDHFTIKVWVTNTGSREMRFRGVDATPRVNRAPGRKLSASLKVRDLAPGQRALVAEITGTWEAADSWVLTVALDADKDVITNRIGFRKR